MWGSSEINRDEVEGKTHCMASFLMAVVASMKRVSVGAILWKTTLEMDDLPLLYFGVSRDSWYLHQHESWGVPFLAHQKKTRLVFC